MKKLQVFSTPYDKQFSIDAFFPISINGGGVSVLIDITIILPYVEDGMNTASGEITLPSRIPSWNPWKIEL